MLRTDAGTSSPIFSMGLDKIQRPWSCTMIFRSRRSRTRSTMNRGFPSVRLPQKFGKRRRQPMLGKLKRQITIHVRLAQVLQAQFADKIHALPDPI